MLFILCASILRCYSYFCTDSLRCYSYCMCTVQVFCQLPGYTWTVASSLFPTVSTRWLYSTEESTPYFLSPGNRQYLTLCDYFFRIIYYKPKEKIRKPEIMGGKLLGHILLHFCCVSLKFAAHLLCFKTLLFLFFLCYVVSLLRGSVGYCFTTP